MLVPALLLLTVTIAAIGLIAWRKPTRPAEIATPASSEYLSEPHILHDVAPSAEAPQSLQVAHATRSGALALNATAASGHPSKWMC